MAGTRAYVDLFAKGKWEDSPDVASVKFGRKVNKFPIRRQGDPDDADSAAEAYGSSCKDKIIAKEGPRSTKQLIKRGFTGGPGVNYFIDLAAEGRYKWFSQKGGPEVFEPRKPSGGHRSYFDRYSEQDKEAVARSAAIANGDQIIENFQELFRPRTDPDDELSEFDRQGLAMQTANIPSEMVRVYGHEIGSHILSLMTDMNSKYKSVMSAAAGEIDKKFLKKFLSGANGTFAWGSFDRRYAISSPDLLRRGVDFANAIDSLFASSAFVEGDDRRPNIHGKKSLTYEAYFGVVSREGSESLWANTRIFKADFDVNLAPLEIRDRMMSEIGVVPRRMDRLITDGKVFERVIPELGASILIDASGSMSISSDTILKIVKLAPASVVAMYYGGSGTIKGQFHNGGFIVVLGENGQACSNPEAYREGGGNYCDGIALRWLGQQPEPRFWVSDGCVTGPGDAGNRNLHADAAWCLNRFNINWINTNDADGLIKIVDDYLKADGSVLDTYREPAA